MLDECCAVTGYHRQYAIRLLPSSSASPSGRLQLSPVRRQCCREDILAPIHRIGAMDRFPGIEDRP
jgi:hypothetical protein